MLECVCLVFSRFSLGKLFFKCSSSYHTVLFIYASPHHQKVHMKSMFMGASFFFKGCLDIHYNMLMMVVVVLLLLHHVTEKVAIHSTFCTYILCPLPSLIKTIIITRPREQYSNHIRRSSSRCFKNKNAIMLFKDSLISLPLKKKKNPKKKSNNE